MSTQLSQDVFVMPAAEGVQVLIDSRFKYAPAIGMTEAPVFRPITRVSNKVKFKALFVKKAAYNARAVNGICDQSAFGQGNPETMRVKEFNGVMYDYSGELCPEDFEQLCEAYKQGLIFRLQNPAQVFAENPMLQLILGLKYETMVDDIQRIVWFATQATFAVNTAGNSAPFYIGEVPTGADATLGGRQNGFWAQAKANVASTATPYVDVNNGSAGGNILNPANTYDILQKFIQKASPELRGLRKNDPASSPFFLVDRAVFEALRNYYTQNGLNTNNLAAWQMQQLGSDVLQIDGYNVYQDLNADKFDSEIGAQTTSTIGGKSVFHSRNCRVVFTVPAVAGMGLDMVSPAGDNIGLIVGAAAERVKRAGMIDWKMMTSVGTEILEPAMMVVGYPSTTATWV